MAEYRTTIVICARNAAPTIARAVESARLQGSMPIVVVDDGSSDDTARIALDAGRGTVRLIKPQRKAGLGNARQAGIHSVETEFAMWLDADDELMPGRVAAMEKALDGGADVVFDAAHLVDSVGDKRIRSLDMPAFMLAPGAMARTFERNYLPGPAWPGLRTEVAKELGYDTALPTGEDLDFNLRALRSGARFSLSTETGYKQIAYGSSLSRDLSLQRWAVRTVLKKHRYRDVEKVFAQNGFDERVACWALCSMAIFREEYSEAGRHLRKAFPPGSEPSEILEPDGPLPVEEGWKHAFFAGTLELLQNGEKGLEWLHAAQAMRRTPEGSNNLGVAYLRAGDVKKAQEQFRWALSQLKGYRDATLNARLLGSPQQITTHPIRRHASRSEYPMD